jgi:hypothetical protein
MPLYAGPLKIHVKRIRYYDHHSVQEVNMSDELAWKWRWWWDPVPFEVFKELGDEAQKQIVAVSLEAQASMLRTQAEALTKIGGLLGGGQAGLQKGR